MKFVTKRDLSTCKHTPAFQMMVGYCSACHTPVIYDKQQREMHFCTRCATVEAKRHAESMWRISRIKHFTQHVSQEIGRFLRSEWDGRSNACGSN